MITLKDVAKKAGVSCATASLALNNKPVNEKTRQRVMNCATKLNYIPNKIGKSLITGKSHTIELLILHSTDYTNIVTETSLYYYIIQGILTIADKYQYSLRFDYKYFEDKYLEKYFEYKMLDKSLDGIIILPQFMLHMSFIKMLKKQHFPYVLLSPYLGKKIGAFNYIDMGNRHGGKLVGEFFIEKKYEKIAFINGPAKHIDAIHREKGFFSVLKKNNIHIPNEAIKYGDFTVSSGYRCIKEIMQSYIPDAVFCTNDYMSAGVIKYLNEHNFSVPSNIAIVGYDNSDVATALFPALTTIDNRFEYVGECLAQNLIRLILGKTDSIQFHVKPKLILRDSHRD